MSDRISEFGFRMHGPSDEEGGDEEDEDVDYEQYEGISPEGGLIIPDLSKNNANSSFQSENSSNTSASTRSLVSLNKSTKELDANNKDASINDVCNRTSSSVESEAVTNNFFPDKTGAELIEMLRQLKFAQKFAWLSGEPTVPIGLSSFNTNSVPSLSAASPHQVGLSSSLTPKTSSNAPTSLSAVQSSSRIFKNSFDTVSEPRPKISAPAFIDNVSLKSTFEPNRNEFDSQTDLSSRSGEVTPSPLRKSNNNNQFEILEMERLSNETLNQYPITSSKIDIRRGDRDECNSSARDQLNSREMHIEIPLPPKERDNSNFSIQISSLPNGSTDTANITRDFEKINRRQPVNTLTDALESILESHSISKEIHRIETENGLDLSTENSLFSKTKTEEAQFTLLPSKSSDKVGVDSQSTLNGNSPADSNKIPSHLPTAIISTSSYSNSDEIRSKISASESAKSIPTVRSFGQAFTSPCLPTREKFSLASRKNSRSLDQCHEDTHIIVEENLQGTNTFSDPFKLSLNVSAPLRRNTEEYVKKKSVGEAPLAYLEEDDFLHEDCLLKPTCSYSESVDQEEVTPLVVIPSTLLEVFHENMPHHSVEINDSKEIFSIQTIDAEAPLPTLRKHSISEFNQSKTSHQNSLFLSCEELHLEFSSTPHVLTRHSVSAPYLTEIEPSTKLCGRLEHNDSIENRVDREVCSGCPSRLNALTHSLSASSTKSDAGLRRQDSADNILAKSQAPLIKSGFSPPSTALLRRLRPDRKSGKLRRPMSGIIPPRSVRMSMMEICQKKWLSQRSTTEIPPTPQVHMGACFTLVFEGSPLTINSTASWINPANNGQILLFGSNDGIYFLSLKNLADSSLELLSPLRCEWLSVFRDTMMSLSGDRPQIYTHNLVTLMKMKAQGHLMNTKLGRISKIFPKRFSPSNKVPRTKGCLKAGLVRHPFNGARYLCAAFPHEILVMEWFNPLSSFIETKRVSVHDIPTPLKNFDLLIKRDQTLPLVCLGVYTHNSKRGRLGERYRLHLVDLNVSDADGGLLSRPSSLVEDNSDMFQFQQYPHHSEVGGINLSPASLVQRPAGGKPLTTDKENHKSFFSESDRLPVVSVIQMRHNTVIVCFQDCAKLLNLDGRLKNKLNQPSTISFDGVMIQSVVGLRDSLLVFHPHGFLGKSFTGELTQEIYDEKHIYRVHGHDQNIVVESRPSDLPTSNSNIYLLTGHKDNLT